MKRIYRIFLVLLSVVVLSWFLPWLYSLLFPVGVNYPFVGYSPVSDSFIVSDNTPDSGLRIFETDSTGRLLRDGIDKNERDSLLPQVYFTQLAAREKLPDSIAGKEVTIPALKHGQWVYSSLPRDINKVSADVYLMMESMPVRFELEDPKVVFRMDNGLEFVDIATNTVDEGKSQRFTDLFAKRGFAYPARSMNADITSRKPYDEGYLMVDANGDVFNVKMQAGRPYMMKVPNPDRIDAAHVFIMENVDRRQLGLMVDRNNDLYVIEREGYRVKPLPVGKVNPETDKVTIMANMFNWIVKVENGDGAVWSAIDADDYSLLGRYELKRPVSVSEKVASYLFPYELSFTEITDCYAYPRVGGVSFSAIYLNVLLSVILLIAGRRKRRHGYAGAVITLVFGIYSFIPLILIKD